MQGVRGPPADRQDRAGARQDLPALTASLPRRELIWAERAHVGGRGATRPAAGGCRSPWRPGGRGPWRRADQEPPTRFPGLEPLPRRWGVERSLAWSGRTRRMSQDDECFTATSEAWISLSGTVQADPECSTGAHNKACGPPNVNGECRRIALPAEHTSPPGTPVDDDAARSPSVARRVLMPSALSISVLREQSP
jgi:hypothetical protein